MISKWPLWLRMLIGIPFFIATLGVALISLLVGGLLCLTIILAPVGIMLIVGSFSLCAVALAILAGNDLGKKATPKLVTGDGEPIPAEVVAQMMAQENPAVSFSNGEIIEFARARSKSNKRKQA